MKRSSLPLSIGFLVVGLAITAIVVHNAIAAQLTEPIGPNSMTTIKSERINNTSYMPKTIYAEAGNVTEVNINATSVTQSWQGYFGNITGQLVLQDANNNTLYDWANLEPQGEIYASINSSIHWPTIRCFNITGSDEGGQYLAIDNWSATTINGTTENNRTGIIDTDVDSINATFNRTVHTQFSVGSVTIPEDACYMTWTYKNNESQTEDFVEVLLTDSAPPAGSNALVFMTIIENDDWFNDTDEIGFDGREHDFQMLVLEDGHAGASELNPTLYYFWVELQ